jgi:methylated-DNA-[protein]-cysteine S-methyltransferase
MAMIQERTAVIYWDKVSSPLGPCFVMATENGVCWTGTPGTGLEEGLLRTKRWLTFDRIAQEEQVEPLRQAVQELQQYFAGEKIAFSCPLDLQGTAFQISVWEALRDIPYGETRSYAEIAQATGRPAAVRAVGAANGANPIAVIVPCHRVIGSNGALIGYGGGLSTKSWLLSLEGIKHKMYK